MFKFNFNNEESVFLNDSVTEENSIQWYESKELKITPDIRDSVEKIPRNQITTLDYNCGLVFFCLSTKEALIRLKEKSDNEKPFDVLKADEKHSDLLPGVYEGGMKIWECTKDVVVHFIKNEIGERTNSLNGKTILDLGCGPGILGIMCLLHGASVTFQDYNQEVLETMTIPNIYINCDDAVTSRVRLYSGDWSSFLNLIIKTNENDRFDYILTSETIYNPQNYKKIIRIFRTLLKPDGTCFMGAKMNYFGVGGSLREFQSLLQEQGMVGDLCWESSEGVARGILKVRLT